MYGKTGIDAAPFIRMLFFCVVLAGVAVADEDDSAFNEATTPCERAARDMLSACKSGVRDDLYTTHANCRSIADSGERKECFVGEREKKAKKPLSCT
jgi:hypothetical protein